MDQLLAYFRERDEKQQDEARQREEKLRDEAKQHQEEFLELCKQLSKLIREERNKLIELQPSTKQEVFAVGSSPCKLDCKFCSSKHWDADCPFRTKLCSTCNIIGHKAGHWISARAFKKRYKQQSSRKERRKQQLSQKEVISVCTTKQGRLRIVRPRINGMHLSLRHDTGTRWVIISRSNWQRIGSPKPSRPRARAVSITGHPVNILGYFSAIIELTDRMGVVDCYVAANELNIFDSSAIDTLELWELPISTHCDSITTTQTHLAKEGSTVNKEQLAINAANSTSTDGPPASNRKQRTSQTGQKLHQNSLAGNHQANTRPGSRQVFLTALGSSHRQQVRLRGKQTCHSPRDSETTSQGTPSSIPNEGGNTRKVLLARISKHIESFTRRRRNSTVNSKASAKEGLHTSSTPKPWNWQTASPATLVHSYMPIVSPSPSQPAEDLLRPDSNLSNDTDIFEDAFEQLPEHQASQGTTEAPPKHRYYIAGHV